MLLNSSKGNVKSYLKKLKKNFKHLFLTPELFSILLIILTFMTNVKFGSICFVIFYTLMFLYFLRKNSGRIDLKKNMSLIIIIALLFIILNVLFVISYLSFENTFITHDTTWVYYLVFVLFSYLAYFVVLIAQLINRLVELFLKKIHKL